MSLILDDGAVDRNWVRSPTGLILSEDAARLRYAPPRHPQGGDIFSGCGGASLGFKQAGIHVRFAVEWDVIAAITYMMNLGTYPCSLHFGTDDLRDKMERELQRYVKPDQETGLVRVGVPRSGSSGVMDSLSVPGTDHMWVWDVSKLTGAMLLDPLGMKPGDLDVLHGSPPCQGFSTAGHQNPKDPRNSLMLEYARLIVELEPKAFTMEQVPNVLNMTTGDGQPMLDAFFECLEAGGYATRKALDKMVEMQGGKQMLLRRGHEKHSLSARNRKTRRKAAKQARTAPADAPVASIAEILGRLRTAEADVPRVAEEAEAA